MVEMKRANYLPAPHAYNLQLACAVLTEAFGPCVYLVGSCLEKRDYRDVDVRAILDDADFDKRFPRLAGGDKPAQFDAEWSLVCTSISLWLGQRTGLPIDFQIQRQTQANEDYKPGTRYGLGLFLATPGGRTVAEASESPKLRIEATTPGTVEDLLRKTKQAAVDLQMFELATGLREILDRLVAGKLDRPNVVTKAREGGQ